MIELITGIPGNGKTLHTISRLLAKSKAENRPVFYSGIHECAIEGWTEIDPTKWADCPPGALIFVDESQKIFRNRSLGAVPPKYVTDLEEHRRLGIDLYFLTQHPSLVDPAIRRLAQTHYHLVRIWGMEASTVHKWNGVKDNCDKSRSDSESSKWAFDKKCYGLYKSAEVHTMKRSIPARVKLLLLVPVLLGAAGFFVYTTMLKKSAPGVAASSSNSPLSHPGQSVPLVGSAAPQAARFDPIADARSYIDHVSPRIAGLPHTAPKYDELTKPVRVPVPAACILRGERCYCLTQQGTPMTVEFNMCVSFAREGWFQDFDADRDRKDSERTAEGERVMAARVPESSLPPSSLGRPSVVSFDKVSEAPKAVAASPKS